MVIHFVKLINYLNVADDIKSIMQTWLSKKSEKVKNVKWKGKKRHCRFEIRNERANQI